jgi:hypothetical protein
LRIFSFDERLEVDEERLVNLGGDAETPKTSAELPITELRLPLGTYLAEVSSGDRQHIFPIEVTRGTKGLQPVAIGPLPAVPANTVYVFGRKAFRPGHPHHDGLATVDVKPFYIQLHEVTIREYVNFLKSLRGSPATLKEFTPFTWFDAKPSVPQSEWDRPVTDISINAARAYAAWLEKQSGLGYRLPSEAEWQLAAGGGDDRDYPYGRRYRSDWSLTGADTPGIVGSMKFDRSPFGVLDMGGNVSEWIDVGKNAGPVAKGGSFRKPVPIWQRITVSQSSSVDIGFRCVVNAPEIPEWPVQR